nr:VP2 [Bat RVJ-like rotavirus BtSY2]
MESVDHLSEKLKIINDIKDKKKLQQEYDNLLQWWDDLDISEIDEKAFNEILDLINKLEKIFRKYGIKTINLNNETEQKKKTFENSARDRDTRQEVEDKNVKEEQQNTDIDRDEEQTKHSQSDQDTNLIDKIIKLTGKENSNAYSNDVLNIRTILSKTLFVDVDSETYSVYVPELYDFSTKPIDINFKTLDTFTPTTSIIGKRTIIPSRNPQLSDIYGPTDLLYSSSIFSDITDVSIANLQMYMMEKALELKLKLPNLPYLSKIEKETNPMNPQNTVTVSFEQDKYYDFIMDRTDRSLDARRNAIQFDNVVVDAQRRNITFPVRFHPIDMQLIRLAHDNAIRTQNLVVVMQEYAMMAADGYVVTPKSRIDRDQRLIYSRRSAVLDRLCELSGLVYRTRILHSMRIMTTLWKTNVFYTSLEDEITRIYAAAEISMVSIDATVSALSTINIGVAKQTLDILLNMSFFRCELELVGAQSSFGSALSAAIFLILLPTDPDHMEEDVFDNLCNLVFNELIAWPSDLPTFVRRNGATNAFRIYVNAGVNREISAYMRFVLLRRPWLPLVQSPNRFRQCHVLIPNVDTANINDQSYVMLNGLLNGIINASRRNPNPGRTINANSFRKLLKNLRDVCVGRLMPVIRLLRYNIERVARAFQFLPYSADLFDINQELRDERLRIRLPISGALSLVMGVTKAPDAFDWSSILKFADNVRKLDYAEAVAVEDAAVVAILKNDMDRSLSKKEILIKSIEPPTPTVAAIAKIPSATLTSIFSDRQLINLIRGTDSYLMITRIMAILNAAFNNIPTSHHGIGKGALLNPIPAPFGRSSQYVRRDNIIFQRPPDVQVFTMQQLMGGQYFQGLIAQIRARRPVFIEGPIQLRVSHAGDLEQITTAYLTMNSPYDSFINPKDLQQQRMLEPREVDLYIDDEISNPNDEFENVMSRTSVYVLDAQRLIVPVQAQMLNFQYHDVMITSDVVPYLTFTVSQPPDLQLFNGLLVYEQ